MSLKKRDAIHSPKSSNARGNHARPGHKFFVAVSGRGEQLSGFQPHRTPWPVTNNNNDDQSVGVIGVNW